MALRIDDRWLWLGFGAFLFVAAKGIAYALRDIVDLTTITEEPESEEDPVKAQEDSISLTSLRTLAHHPNPDIRHASTRILLKRFLAHPTAPSLLSTDFQSPDASTRYTALQAVHFIHTHGFHVDPFSRTLQTHDPQGLLNRQRAALNFDATHLDLDPQASNFDDGRSVRISGETYTLPTAAQERILSVRRRRRESARMRTGTDDSTGVSPAGESTAASAGAGARLSRGWDESPEETELRRRRHREAMVLHEGGGGLSEQDIIQGPSMRSVGASARDVDPTAAMAAEIHSSIRHRSAVANARAEAEAAGVLGGNSEEVGERDEGDDGEGNAMVDENGSEEDED